MDEPMIAVVIRGEAKGAIANGTRVRKCTFEEGDSVQIGGLGTVYSSIAVPIEVLSDQSIATYGGDEYAYFIIWDDLASVPVFTRGYKVEAAA